MSLYYWGPYWNNDRLSLTNTGMGKTMSMTSVMMFSTPAQWSAKCQFGRSWSFTECDQLHLRLATFSRVWKDLPIEIERSAFAESHDLNNDIAGSEGEEKRYHGNSFPRKVKNQMSVEVEKYQFLKPETASFCQCSPQQILDLGRLTRNCRKAY